MTLRKNPWRWVFLAITVLWCGLIFWMSAMEGEESTEGSNRVMQIVADIFFPHWRALPEADYVRALGQLAFFIRKAAHFLEFAVLGAGLSLIFLTIRRSFRFRFLFSALIGILYAVSDELHQFFVPGRDGTVFDVLVDAAGVLLGVLAVLGIAAMAAGDRERIKG